MRERRQISAKTLNFDTRIIFTVGWHYLCYRNIAHGDWTVYILTKLICFIDSSPKPDLYDSLGSSIICFLKRFVSYQNLKKQGFEFKAESMRTNVHVLAAFKLSIDIGDTPRIVKLSVLVLAWYSRLTLVTFK